MILANDELKKLITLGRLKIDPLYP
ncbi:MAG: dCTP deaminase, partial [Pyrobaculum sp.]